MYTLINTMNGRAISRHRTLDAAAKAAAKLLRQVKGRNGGGSYLPTQVLDANGANVPYVTDHEGNAHRSMQD